jgi:adenosylcobinamide hydrolase
VTGTFFSELPSVCRAADGTAVLAWRLRAPALAISSAPHGGGIGSRHWVLNAQVPIEFPRTDLARHLETLASGLGLAGDGVGFLTAADVTAYEHSTDSDATACATVGLAHPTWAADDDGATNTPYEPRVGTINIVATVPLRLSDSALVNAIATVTEAKSQALAEFGVPGTGTASDAICVLCPTTGAAEHFAGPRAALGAPLARAVYRAVRQGTALWQRWHP